MNDKIRRHDKTNLQELFLVIKKRKVIILSVFVISILVFLIVPTRHPAAKPVYRSTLVLRVPTSFSYNLIPLITTVETEQLIKNFYSQSLNQKREGVVSVGVKPLGNTSEFVQISLDVFEESTVNDFKNALVQFLNNDQHLNELIASSKKWGYVRKFEVTAEPAVLITKPVQKPRPIYDIAFVGISSLCIGIFFAYLLEWFKKNKISLK